MPSAEMLCVWSLSGQEILAIPFADLPDLLKGASPTVCSLKRHLNLRCRCGVSRFQLRLTATDGTLLGDEEELTSPMDLQLVVQDFIKPNRKQVKELKAAVAGGLASEVEAILQRPQDPTIQVKRPTPLEYASYEGRADLVSLLLEAVPAEKRSWWIDSPGHACLVSAANGHGNGDQQEVLRLLLQAKANVNRGCRSVPMGCEMGRAYEHATPLGWAIWELNVGAVEIFLEAKADINQRCWQLGPTPLAAAAKLGDVRLEQLLLQADARNDEVSS
ncbi:Kidins220 [Symbiodinium pilosum]|uniref:Kidins220 protein n=1 Tax=Symbiodinium pilosum TaxID=2952 RepID=A0A812PPM8_SYMPI|nr:Kidins220 [Symbiodinium pilosum]